MANSGLAIQPQPPAKTNAQSMDWAL